MDAIRLIDGPSWTIFWCILWAIVGVIIGGRKGKALSGLLWSFLCGPFGVLIVVLDKGNRRECPFCVEQIHREASVCPHCQRELSQSSYFDNQQVESNSRTRTIAIIVII